MLASNRMRPAHTPLRTRARQGTLAALSGLARRLALCAVPLRMEHAAALRVQARLEGPLRPRGRARHGSVAIRAANWEGSRSDARKNTRVRSSPDLPARCNASPGHPLHAWRGRRACRTHRRQDSARHGQLQLSLALASRQDLPRLAPRFSARGPPSRSGSRRRPERESCRPRERRPIRCDRDHST